MSRCEGHGRWERLLERVDGVVDVLLLLRYIGGRVGGKGGHAAQEMEQGAGETSWSISTPARPPGHVPGRAAMAHVLLVQLLRPQLLLLRVSWRLIHE
jgi:hypothetical protein